MKSVADWLVAGRGIGRYLGIVADTGQGIGVVSIITILQVTYVAGPTYFWYYIQTLGLGLVLALTGWGVYRLRETRVMTINELMERRYSRKLRFFCGFLCFISGIINMGLFPIVTGRFFVYFCGLPFSVDILGLALPTVPLVTAIILFVAVLFCLVGGQISVIITDYIQTSIVMILFIAIGFITYGVVKWEHVEESLRASPNISNMVNPLNFNSNSQFNIWFFVMISFALVYNILSWAPNMIRGQSAKDPNEAKVMMLLSYLRVGFGVALFCFVPIACFAFMNLPIFNEKASAIREVIEQIGNPNVRSQMVVPMFLSHILPAGMFGFFVAGMLAAAISSFDTYILTWSSVFVQDIVMPLRKKPLKPKHHLLLLKIAVIVIALFSYFFGMLYTETDFILMFMMVTAAIYTAGAGAVILGALYWKKGTTAGAWSAMISGCVIASCGLILPQFIKNFPFNGLQVNFIANITSTIMYIVVSLLTRKKDFDIETLLHRKDGKNIEVNELKIAGSRNWFLRNIYQILWALAIILVVITVWVICHNITHNVNPETWLTFWKYYVFGLFFWTIPATIWMIAGGGRDLYRFFKKLKVHHVDVVDDGFVRDISYNNNSLEVLNEKNR